jgi:hypothetical protein
MELSHLTYIIKTYIIHNILSSPTAAKCFATSSTYNSFFPIHIPPSNIINHSIKNGFIACCARSNTAFLMHFSSNFIGISFIALAGPSFAS